MLNYFRIVCKMKWNFHIFLMHLELSFFCYSVLIWDQISHSVKKKLWVYQQPMFERYVLLHIIIRHLRWDLYLRCLGVKKIWKRKNLQVTFLTQTAMSEKYLVYSFTMSIQMQYNTKHVLKTATQFIPKRCKKSSHMFVLDNLCSSLRRNKEKI